jgi:hypothetical protein
MNAYQDSQIVVIDESDNRTAPVDVGVRVLAEKLKPESQAQEHDSERRRIPTTRTTFLELRLAWRVAQSLSRQMFMRGCMTQSPEAAPAEGITRSVCCALDLW